jgi:hypothetical protein
MKFTETSIKDLPVPNKVKEHSCDELPGFRVQVTPTGTKTYYLLYQFEGRKRRFRIGRFQSIKLKDAKEAAKIAVGEVTKGVDPQAEKIKKVEKQQQAKHAKDLQKQITLRIFLDEQYYPFAYSNQKSPYRTKQILEHNF